MTTETTKTEACHDTAVVGSRPLPTISSAITLTREQVDQISAGIRAVQRTVEEVVQFWRQVTEASEVLQMQHPSPGDQPGTQTGDVNGHVIDLESEKEPPLENTRRTPSRMRGTGNHGQLQRQAQ